MDCHNHLHHQHHLFTNSPYTTITSNDSEYIHPLRLPYLVTSIPVFFTVYICQLRWLISSTFTIRITNKLMRNFKHPVRCSSTRTTISIWCIRIICYDHHHLHQDHLHLMLHHADPPPPPNAVTLKLGVDECVMVKLPPHPGSGESPDSGPPAPPGW